MKKPATFILALLLSTASITIPNSTFSNPVFVSAAETASDTKANETTEEGEKDGEYFGILDGYTRGIYYYKLDKPNTSYATHIKDDLKVYTSNSDFLKKSTDYKKAFPNGYDEGYKFGFNLGISGDLLSSTELITLAESDTQTFGTEGEGAGSSSGSSAGSNQASIDYARGLKKEASFSLERFESSKSLNNRYMLSGYDTTFVNDFLTNFRQSYIDSYNNTYDGLLSSFVEQNNQYERVYNSGSSYSFNLQLDGDGKTVQFGFPAGAMYGEGIIGAYKNREAVQYDAKKLKFVDKDFYITVDGFPNFSYTDYISFNKPFMMGIEYFGSDDVGIYEFRNNAWQYIKTDIKDGYVEHTFEPQDYYGGHYCLFLQPNYKKFIDTSFSPFNEEIYVYARRGVVYAPSNKLYPTSYMSRGEFSYMINGLFNPTDKGYYPTKSFTDQSSFGPYENAINFVTTSGYLNGVSSTKFDVSGKLTYNQLKIVLERITGETVNMNEIFSSMVNDKFHRSNGAKNMNNYVTREEAIYILYYVFK